MKFEKKISEIFLSSIKQNVDFNFFIDTMINWNEKQKTESIDWYNSIVDNQNKLFLKIVHIYSITIFETFNQDFFNEIDNVKTLSKKHVTTTPSKMLGFFQSNFKINLETDFNYWNDLKENICRRNVITHNMGRIDKKYQDCISSNLNILNKMIGSDILHDINYVKISNHTVVKYIIFTFKKIVEFYNLINIDSIIKSIANHPNFGEINPNLLNEESYFFEYKVELIED